jgi:thioredoxin-like negative regulator of GroEL
MAGGILCPLVWTLQKTGVYLLLWVAFVYLWYERILSLHSSDNLILQEPIYDRLASELKGTVNVGKSDATVHKSLAARFPISGYPSIYFIKAGQVYEFKGR